MPYAGQIDKVRGEFSSADATEATLDEAGARYTLYLDGTTSTTTIGSTDQFVLTGVTVYVAGSTTFHVYGGADDVKAGDQMVCGSATTTGIVQSGHRVAAVAGTYPKLETAIAAQVDSVIYGYIIRGANS